MTQTVTLNDRYLKRSGRILITGVQALVRLMVLQADRDEQAGLRTGGFVSGYRGSPLGTLDSAFATIRDLTDARNIRVRPAVNEELAATAIAGTQQIAQATSPKVQGVFALWYGKGPGLDRAADAIRHLAVQGSSPHGGVVIAVGDDHGAKSSTVVCNSDEAVAGMNIPLFYPADAGEIVDFGLHGFAVSRHTGCVVALKVLAEIADSTRSVPAGSLDMTPVLPEIVPPPFGLHNRWPEFPLEQERRHIEHRLPAVLDYVRANDIDRQVLKDAGSRIGLVGAGKSWLDLQEALRLLGLDPARMSELGIALYKPGLIWPLEPGRLSQFADSLDHLVVIEEKGPFIERQIKALLFGSGSHPQVWGKAAPDGGRLIPQIGELTPEAIAAALGPWLSRWTNEPGLMAVSEQTASQIRDLAPFALPPTIRKPFFCSGCPHNRSTVVPEGSRATAGIGCHGLAAYNRERTGTFAQMGGEGVHWVGLEPFADDGHMFANMGDGTYFHSGILAIRQSVAAGVNITYKLLYNGAVAMTGGQAIDGELPVLLLVDQLQAEGVSKVVISADDPDRYPADDPVRQRGVEIGHRDDLDALQLRMRDTPGVSVIIYDQMCATERRRMRKRGKVAEGPRRVFINELVCEGCGDCSVKSNCLSVEPAQTELGTKRRINQSSCNKDYSCLNGFCPSFVTVEGAQLRQATPDFAKIGRRDLPAPLTGPLSHDRMLVAGVGGTGVVTIGALIAMAGHIDGADAGVLDQVGMAQKGGAVVSHIHLAAGSSAPSTGAPIQALRIPAESADLIIACDQVVGNMRDVMAAIRPGVTTVIANSDIPITGDFTTNRNAIPDAGNLSSRLRDRVGAEHYHAYPFSRISQAVFGDAIGSNLMMLGMAWQLGAVKLSEAAVNGAIELNRTAVEMNKAAFALGRQLAVDPQAVIALAGLADAEPRTLGDTIDYRAGELRSYQNAAYAERYRARMQQVQAAEEAAGGDLSLSAVVARALYQVMAYKDEYEVARLFTDGRFATALSAQFTRSANALRFYMAPPLFARRDPATGQARKVRFGGWILPVMRLLARGKALRGTAFDPFGYHADRRAERRLIAQYERLLDEMIADLAPDNLDRWKHIAGLILQVRGYGNVKEQAMQGYETELQEARSALAAPPPTTSRELADVAA